MSLQNLKEDFLYNRLPEGLLTLDERQLLQAVIGGYQDRIEDLRSFVSKYELFFQSDGFPEEEDNVVLVQIVGPGGKTVTRTLNIEPDTPDASETDLLLQWATTQLGLSSELVLSAQYGRDLLRLVDINMLQQLAATVGAVLYETAVQDPDQLVKNQQQALAFYFPRLQIKGTAMSFDVLGRLIGFDDVRMTPLWSRLSPRVANDPGAPANDSDFAQIPEYVPQKEIDVFYNPHVMDDGPFYHWEGTASAVQSETDFYTQVINGFQPWIKVLVVGTEPAHPAENVLTLEGGAPHTFAKVIPDNTGMVFQAIAEGDSFNGLEIHFLPVDSGTRRLVSISDRLSAVKYRSSFFDLAMTVEDQRAIELYGTTTARRNEDLADNPVLTDDGTAASPFRPWKGGQIETGSVSTDFLHQVTDDPVAVISPRTQATVADRQLDLTALIAAGVQAVEIMEEVRSATRFPRRSRVGLLHSDDVTYAKYQRKSELFTTTSGTNTYSGTTTAFPEGDYAVDMFFDGTALAAEALDESTVLFADAGGSITGYYGYGTNGFQFDFSPGVETGKVMVACWTPLTTEVVREEPLDTVDGTCAYQARPEDEVDVDSLLYEVSDEYPWRTDLQGAGWLVEIDTYQTTLEDLETQLVQEVIGVFSQEGVEYDVYVINSGSQTDRFVTEAKETGADYVPSNYGIAFAGAFRDLDGLTGEDTSIINSLDNLDVVMEPGWKLYHAALVQGVLVADGPRFFGEHHRLGLAGWFPFNEHPDDNLEIRDASIVNGSQTLEGIESTARVWDDSHGWSLRLADGASVQSEAFRGLSDQFALSFWINPEGTLTSAGSTAVFEYGPIRLDLQHGSPVLDVSVLTMAGTYDNPASIALDSGTLQQVVVMVQDTGVLYGKATLDDALVLSTGTLAEAMEDFTSDDVDLVLTGAPRAFVLHDMRLWDLLKDEAQLNKVRYHNPVNTAAQYRIGWFRALNRRDRWTLKLLPNGWLTPERLPAWIRASKYARVQRYDSDARYHGESRFKEVGLGGGMELPEVWALGTQLYTLTATGRTVVSTQHSNMPGVNSVWTNDTVAGDYLSLTAGSVSSGSLAELLATGTTSPWPNPMLATNPCREAIWIEGVNGDIYEVTLIDDGTVHLQAELIARQRTDAELALTGSDAETWRYAELPTGALIEIAGGGTHVVVESDGTTVVQQEFSGTDDRPPVYMYLHSQIQEEKDGQEILDAWEDPTTVGLNLGVPALETAGELGFVNTATLEAGNYRLIVDSGNIQARLDQSFDGFDVEIRLGATVLRKRLLATATGYDPRGQDTFEFELEEPLSGEWILSFQWFNDFDEPSKGTARQLAIYGYTLERVATQLYRVTVAASGTNPQLDLMTTEEYAGTTPGGWLMAYNSYGTIAERLHESTVFPTNDTVTSVLPLADILTSDTHERREDFLHYNGSGTDAPAYYVLLDAGTEALPSFSFTPTPPVAESWTPFDLDIIPRNWYDAQAITNKVDGEPFYPYSVTPDLWDDQGSNAWPAWVQDASTNPYYALNGTGTGPLLDGLPRVVVPVFSNGFAIQDQTTFDIFGDFPFMYGLEALSVFAVALPEPSGFNDATILTCDASSGEWYYLLSAFYGAGGWDYGGKRDAGDTQQDINGTITLDTNEFSILNTIIDYGNTRAQMFVDGSPDVTAVFQTAGTSSTSGGFPTRLGQQAQIAEFLDLDYVPTEADRQRIEGYQAWRWNLVSKLPVGHPYKSAPPPKPDPVALAVNHVARMATAGVTATIFQEHALNVIGRAIESIGEAKFLAVYPFVGETAATHALDLMQNFDITWNGTVTHDEYGPKSDGSTGYGDTGIDGQINLNHFDNAAGVYSSAKGTVDDADSPMGMVGSSNYFLVWSAAAGYQALLEAKSSEGNPAVGPNAAYGFFMASITSGGTITAYKDGVELATRVNTGHLAGSFGIKVLARDSVGTLTGYWNLPLGFMFISQSLTPTEVDTLTTAVLLAQRILARNV